MVPKEHKSGDCIQGNSPSLPEGNLEADWQGGTELAAVPKHQLGGEETGRKAMIGGRKEMLWGRMLGGGVGGRCKRERTYVCV